MPPLWGFGYIGHAARLSNIPPLWGFDVLNPYCHKIFAPLGPRSDDLFIRIAINMSHRIL